MKKKIDDAVSSVRDKMNAEGGQGMDGGQCFYFLSCADDGRKLDTPGRI